MRKLLYAAAVAGASLLPAGVTQAQCVCGGGYYGYGFAYNSYAALYPAAAPAYYAYPAPAYYRYDVGDVDAYYGGWGGYGVAGAGVNPGYYGYGARIDGDRLGYGHRPIGVGRIGRRGGYAYRHNAHRHGLTPPPPSTFDLKRPTPEGAD